VRETAGKDIIRVLPRNIILGIRSVKSSGGGFESTGFSPFDISFTYIDSSDHILIR
jgi:hypothetical protein